MLYDDDDDDDAIDALWTWATQRWFDDHFGQFLEFRWKNIQKCVF